MTPPPISEDVAIRIALAARALPQISIGELIGALQDTLGETLTEAALSKVTVTQLKRAFGTMVEVDGEWEGEEADNSAIAQLKAAVSILWGTDLAEPETDLPPTAPYQPGDMPQSVRVAVASNTGEELDGHFGSCSRFLIYQLSTTEIRLVEVRSARAANLNEDKNRARVALIQDCSVVYVASIGGPAAAKVVQANIYPMKVETGGNSRTVLAALQHTLATAPPPWLAKILGVDANHRLKNYSAVG